MKRAIIFIIILMGADSAFSQKNAPSGWDPVLEAHCEKWKIIVRQKMFGDISKVEFGPFSTASIEKLDSPMYKRKTKSGAEFDLDLGYDARMKTGNDVNMDIIKKIATQKSKYYRMLLAGNTDTTETLCSILSVTKEDKETIGGAVLKTLIHGHYSSEENKTGLIGYMEVINGFILTSIDSLPWKFFFTLGKGNNNASPGSFRTDTLTSFRYFSGYIKNQDDSINIEQIFNMSTYKFLGKADTFYMGNGFALVNQAGKHLAAYQNIGPDKKSPYIWMSKDAEDSYQQAISSFLAIILARKKYQDMLTIK